MIIRKVAIAVLWGVLCLRVAAAEIEAMPVQLTAVERQMAAWIAERQDDLLAALKTHVEINTGTHNLAGIDQYRRLLAKELQALGFTTRERASEPVSVLSCEGGQLAFANHLIAERKGSKPSRLLLSGHMDTVFAPQDSFQKMTVDQHGTIRGPGVADMKGGLVVMLYALQALAANGRLDDANITILLNSDEEIGSLGSRQLIEELARAHDVGFVFEGSYQNTFTRARKGLGQVRLKITGRESHAGAAHERGVSANLALAQKVVEIEKLTDYAKQMTVNVGMMRGGEKRNTIPGCADAYIDLRFPTLADGEYLKSAIERIADKPSVVNPLYPDLPNVEVWGRLHRPVKAIHPQVDELIAEAMGLSLLLGEPIVGASYSGGGTDGSIAQAVGLPTVDSMGVDADGIHSSREKTTVKSLLARAQLAAVMIGRQIDKRR